MLDVTPSWARGRHAPSKTLFARLKARAASECARLTRSAATLPRLDGPVAMEDHQLSNAALFELLDP